MTDVASMLRYVLVLGRNTENLGSPTSLVALARGNELEVSLLSVGFPVTPQQQAFVAEAVDLAVDAGIRLDAEILAGTADIAGHIRGGEDVRVASRGLERRRIEAILRKRGARLAS
jgi:hypothetical protein